MTEMHLDLCIQSTTHLLQTFSNIKENVRILEVFLNSGIANMDYIGNTAGFISGDYSIISDGRVSSESKGLQHPDCCCMCRLRQNLDRDLNGNTSRASAVTTSMSSNPPSRAKKVEASAQSRPAPPMPRLNKTASLRMETALERQKRMVESARRKPFK